MQGRAKAWFAPKVYGYGAGLPVRWQGWAAIGLFVAGVAAAQAMLHGLPRLACIGLLTVAIVAVAAAKTEGGWRWRWGRDR